MSEGNDVLSRPKQLISQALKKVRGENTLQLVEDFTSEMTLVAEGLCEDQGKLRTSLEDMRRDQDRTSQDLKSQIDVMEKALDENQKDTERRLTELTRRLDAMENLTKRQEHKLFGKLSVNGSFMQQLTVLVSIVAGSWVLVTILNLFH